MARTDQLSTLTARFLDEEQEAEFWHDRFHEQLHSQIPTFYRLIAVVSVFMGIVDWLTLPREVQPLVQSLRFGVMLPAIISASLFSRKESYRPYHQCITTALGGIAVGYILLLHVFGGPARGLFPMVLAPLVVVLPLVFRLHIPWALGHWVSTAVAYLVVNALWVQAENAAVGVVMSTILAFGVVGLFVLRRTEEAARQQFLDRRSIEIERARSERLLLNILPPPIAVRLKEHEGPIADEFSRATVLFADIAGFTDWSATVSPATVVQRLQKVFSAFDTLAVRHGCEKIKTIGDAYMVAAGLPLPREDHAEAIANMSLDMLEVLAELNQGQECPLQLRIGINSGPVVAGVIGSHKFAYDLWGDAVNLASRMESHGVIGRIQVTESVYEVLKDQYCFEARGVIDIKGKGELSTWFLLRRNTIAAPGRRATIS